MDKVLIIVVNWNGADILKKCLNSLDKTDYQNYQIVVVDNNSNLRNVNYLKKNKKVIPLFLDKNYGYCYAINRGIEYGLKNGFKIFINLNNDAIIPRKNWLKEILKNLNPKNVGAVGVKIVGYDKRIQAAWYGKRMINQIDRGQYEEVKEASAVSGVLIAYKKETIEKVGFFDERHFFGEDDLDFCFRVRKGGLKVIYDGKIKVIHFGGYSSNLSGGKSGELFKSMQKGHLLFTFTHKGLGAKIGLLAKLYFEIFITKKDRWDKFSLKNLRFHKDFIERSHITTLAVFETVFDI